MKKFLTIIITVAMIFSFSACTKSDVPEEVTEDVSVEEVAEDSAEELTEEVIEDEAEEESGRTSGISDFADLAPVNTSQQVMTEDEYISEYEEETYEYSEEEWLAELETYRNTPYVQKEIPDGYSIFTDFLVNNFDEVRAFVNDMPPSSLTMADYWDWEFNWPSTTFVEVYILRADISCGYYLLSTAFEYMPDEDCWSLVYIEGEIFDYY